MTDVDIHPYVGLLGGSDGKEYACNGGHLGSIPGLERCPWKGNALENSMDIEEPTVNGVIKSWFRRFLCNPMQWLKILEDIYAYL